MKSNVIMAVLMLSMLTGCVSYKTTMTRTETGVVLTSNGRGVSSYTKGDETCTVDTTQDGFAEKVKRAIGKVLDTIGGVISNSSVVAD